MADQPEPIEAQEKLARLVKEMLSQSKLTSFKIEHFERVGTALVRLKQGGIDVVLSDLKVPDSQGLDTFKRVYAQAPSIPIVLVTGTYEEEELALEALRKGAQDYLKKDALNSDLLVRSIRYALERKQLEEALKAANEKLKEMDKRKSAFVANVSHEFKNPLTVIKEALGIIIEGLAGEMGSEQKNILSSAKSSIERLIRLVTDLLDLSKIEAGKMEMRRENFDIAVLINDILVNYEKELAKKEISLKKDMQGDIGAIWADRDKINEVVINLLNNAIKYTPSQGAITVKLYGSEKEIHFEISDTGPGIPAEYKDKIFDKFERITAEKTEGTGLGLPIAKDIVELHKGRIWVESPAWKDLPACRQGSRFIFVLPRDLRGKNTSR